MVLCDKRFEDLHFHNKYESGGRREKRKKEGEKAKPSILGGEALRLIMVSFILKNKVHVSNISLLKNFIHISTVLEGTLCVIWEICAGEVVRDLFSVPLGKCHGTACVRIV